MGTTIRPLQMNDFPHWLPLWDGNNMGHRDEAVTTETWARLTDPDNTQVNGLAAIHNGELAGILHYILHPTTGHLRHACYMQDVFVAETMRRRGIGKALVEELARIGKRAQWARLYWLAENGNENAQGLYKNLGVKLDFTLHVMMV